MGPLLSPCLAAVFVALAAAAPPAGEQVLAEWRFDGDGDLEGWQASATWKNARVAGGCFQAELGDSVREHLTQGMAVLNGPEIDPPVVVGGSDYVEIRYRASRSGWVRLYYAVADEGQPRGFHAAGAEIRRLEACETLRTLRIRPRWAEGAHLARLRLDGPSRGGTLAIEAIRVCRGAPAPDRAPRWDLRDGETQARFGAPGAARLPEGVRLQGRDGPAVFTLDGLAVDAEANLWLRLRMRTTSGTYGGILYHPANRGHDKATRRHFASTEFWRRFAIPLRPDGRMHTYNVCLAPAGPTPAQWTGFQGVQRTLHLVPSYDPAAESVVESVSFGPGPEGDPCLAVEYCGPAEALYRVGRPGVLALRVRNVGGAPATGIRLHAQPPAGMRAESGAVRGIPESLPPDQVATLYVDVHAERAGRFEIPLRLECVGDALSATAAVSVEPAVRLPAGEVPPPRPVKTPYEIGCYYFTGWWGLTHWPKLPPLAERRPALGFYDEASPTTADWDIKWAVEHGVDHLVVLWYWHNGKRQDGMFIEKALLKSRFISDIKFCVMWCNSVNPWWKWTEADFDVMADTWIRDYFPHPSYRKTADGRPEVWFLSAWALPEIFGKERWPVLLRRAEEKARAAGFPGIAWVACQHGARHFLDDPAPLRQAGFAASTLYTLAGQTSDNVAITPARQLVETAPDVWGSFPMTPILPLFCGWGSLWNGRDFTLQEGFTPELFREHLQQAKEFLDARGLKRAVIDCWNEWGEGEILGPHAEHGFRLLQQIPAVFAPGAAVAPPVVPEDVDFFPPEIPGLWERVPRPPLRGTTDGGAR